jgi:Na+/H+ antiporter NhaD/arsenite permease-like protein
MLKLLFAILIFVIAPVFAFANEGNDMLDGATLTAWWILPFAGMLLSIALLPLISHKFWDKYFPLITLFWVFVLLVPMVINFDTSITIHKMRETLLEEYMPFIILLFALYTISGGIEVAGKFQGTPFFNTMYLAIGTILASWIGTTGAAMLLIRPLIKAIAWRDHRKHVIVFFIFLVANVGGSLTPLGDPPLFLGFLKGIDFFWPIKNMFGPMMIVSVILLVTFYILDKLIFMRDKDFEQKYVKEKAKLRIEGKHNLILLGLVVVAVLLSGKNSEIGMLEIYTFKMSYADLIRDVSLIILALVSYKVTPQKIRDVNHFQWLPMREVAILFIGIFVTMIPAISILRAGLDGALAPIVQMTMTDTGEPFNLEYFWITGLLSSFLDNAPTYLVFYNLAGGDADVLMTSLGTTLLAISAGAVFMGANTYIGNAPNLMVKSIASSRGINMPGFFGYMGWSIVFLVPTYILISWIYFT